MASKSLAVRSLFYEERQKRGSSGLGVSFLLDFLTGMVLCKDTETKKSIFVPVEPASTTELPAMLPR